MWGWIFLIALSISGSLYIMSLNLSEQTLIILFLSFLVLIIIQRYKKINYIFSKLSSKSKNKDEDIDGS